MKVSRTLNSSAETRESKPEIGRVVILPSPYRYDSGAERTFMKILEICLALHMTLENYTFMYNYYYVGMYVCHW